MITFLREQIRTTGDGPDINPSNVRCRRCPPNWRQHGGFDSNYGILLCANNLRTRSKVEDSLAHEMIHAYDHVRFKVDPQNLRHQACTEIRASTLSGECRFTREFWSRGQYKFNQGMQDCVKRRAALSMMNRPGVKDDVQAAKLVNEVWDSCFVDTRPFDEVYRWQESMVLSLVKTSCHLTTWMHSVGVHLDKSRIPLQFSISLTLLKTP